MTCRSSGVIAAVATAYVLAALACLQWQLPGTNATPVWLPSGIGFVAVLRLGWRGALGVYLGAAVANSLTLPIHAWAALLIAIGNTAEHVVAVRLLRPRVRVTDDCRLLFLSGGSYPRIIRAAVAGSAIAGAWGPGVLWLTGSTDGAIPFWQVAATWALGDLDGMLLAAPLAYQVGAVLRSFHTWRLLGLIAWTFAVFHDPHRDHAPLAYLVMPAVAWIAFTLYLPGAGAASLAVTAIALPNTIAGRGPFVTSDLPQSLVMLQLFLCVAAGMALAFGSVVQEQMEIQRRISNELSNLKSRTHG